MVAMTLHTQLGGGDSNIERMGFMWYLGVKNVVLDLKGPDVVFLQYL